MKFSLWDPLKYFTRVLISAFQSRSNLHIARFRDVHHAHAYSVTHPLISQVIHTQDTEFPTVRTKIGAQGAIVTILRQKTIDDHYPVHPDAVSLNSMIIRVAHHQNLVPYTKI